MDNESILSIYERRSNYMGKKNKSSKICIWEILWERKVFYLAGFIFSILIGLLNKTLGIDVKNSDFIALSFSSSFIFGFLLYLFIKEPEKIRKEGRTIIFSKEGLIHIALSLGFIIFFGFINNII